MDGRYITEARTAAVSAVSVQHLARKDAGGPRDHRHRRPGAQPSRGDRQGPAAHAMSASGARTPPASPGASSPRCSRQRGRDHCRGSRRTGAVRTPTSSCWSLSAKEPVVRSEWIADGTHICAVGACRPTQREMDAALVARADLYVDSREAALAEAGDIVLAIRDGAIDASHIKGELGEVVTGGRLAGTGSQERDDLQVPRACCGGRGDGAPGLSTRASARGRQLLLAVAPGQGRLSWL